MFDCFRLLQIADCKRQALRGLWRPLTRPRLWLKTSLASPWWPKRRPNTLLKGNYITFLWKRSDDPSREADCDFHFFVDGRADWNWPRSRSPSPCRPWTSATRYWQISAHSKWISRANRANTEPTTVIATTFRTRAGETPTPATCGSSHPITVTVRN